MTCLFREEMNSIYSGKKWVVLTHGRNSCYVEILLQLKWSWHRAKHPLSLLRVKRRSNSTTGTTGGAGTANTFPEHLSSHPVFSGVRVTWSLVLCVCFVDRCLSFCPLFFWPLYCLSFFDWWIPITLLISSDSPLDCMVWLNRTDIDSTFVQTGNQHVDYYDTAEVLLQLNPAS
jgi:hypothetical protein